METNSENRLKEVCPSLAALIRTVAGILSNEGIDIRVTQGLRSWQMQLEIWQQGRDAMGKVINPKEVVSNAPPGHSWHEFGLAVDVAPFVNDQPDWELEHPCWSRIVAVGESVGLTSGSKFTTPDFPHLQYQCQYPLSPNDAVRVLYREGGLKAIWNSLQHP